jgi:hypothetical protein
MKHAKAITYLSPSLSQFIKDVNYITNFLLMKKLASKCFKQLKNLYKQLNA